MLLGNETATPGRSVGPTAGLASVVAVSFEATCAALAVARCFVTGTPIRDTAAVDRLAARERLGLAPDDRLMLIFGGSQALGRVTAAIDAALPALVERFRLLQGTGDAGYAPALAARERLPGARRAPH